MFEKVFFVGKFFFIAYLLIASSLYAETWKQKDGGDNPLDNIKSFTYLFADFDGDDDLDLYEYNGTNDNYHLNNGDNTFTLTTGVNNPFRDVNATLLYHSHGNTVIEDLDGDNDLDIFFTKDNIFRYFINTDGQTYEEKTGADNPFNLLVVDANTFLYDDFDDDNDSDLYVFDGTNNNYYENDGSNVFVKNTNNTHPFRNVTLDFPSYGNTVVEDFDKDGDLDILFAESNIFRYFENTDGVTYEEKIGITNPFNGISVGYNTFLYDDFDDDNDSDLYVYNGTSDKYYENNGSNAYTEVTDNSHPLDRISSTLLYPDKEDTLVCDYNNDGDMDIFYLDSNDSYIYHTYYLNTPPSLDPIANQQNLEDFSDFNITLVSSDAQNDPINFTVSSSDTSIATVSIVNGKIVITSVENQSGLVTIEVNATDNDKTTTQSFDLNISAVDDAPYFTAQQGSFSVDEDSQPYSVLLEATDIESDAFTYAAAKSNNKVNISLVDNNLTITPAPNAHGVVVLDVNVTQDNNASLTQAYSFTLTIDPLNDAPMIDTVLTDISIVEDYGSMNIELNVSDIEGDDLNLTVDSNDSSILTVTQNWTNQLAQGDYDGLALDFNLTTVANAYGIARITVFSDDGDKNSTRSFDVNVTALNDAPLSRDGNFTIDEDNNKTFVLNDFNFTDVDDGDTLNSIFITTLPINGVVTVNDVNVTLNQEILSADIGNLKFIPELNGEGIPYASFDFKVNDGDLNATSAQTVTINVNAINDVPESLDINITMDEDTSRAFRGNDFIFRDVDVGDSLHSIVITSLPSDGRLSFNDVNVTLNQEILDVNISSLRFTPVPNAFGIPYTSFGFKVSDGDANSSLSYLLTMNVNDVAEPRPPTPTTEPQEPEEPNENDDESQDLGQLLKSDADKLDTGVLLDEINDTEESIELTFVNTQDGTSSSIKVGKIEGKTINTLYSANAIEFTMDDSIISYNNNGTTEHAVSVDNKETVAISYIPGAVVEFTSEGGLTTTVEYENSDGEKSEIVVNATPQGYAETSVKNANGISTQADSTIPGTQTVVQEDGKVVVDTPSVVSNLGNEITTKTTLDADGNAVISAVKVLPNGTEEEIPLGGYDEGSEIRVEYKNGAVVVEVVTSIGTETFILRSGRR